MRPIKKENNHQLVQRSIWAIYKCLQCGLKFRFECWNTDVPEEGKVMCPICQNPVKRVKVHE
jgi:DNA-directed RNA polymerase subunit RPC12/RpoP